MGKRRFGMAFKVRSDASKLVAPDHDMTEAEAEELRELELDLFRCAHRLGVHVVLELKFPLTSAERGST